LSPARERGRQLGEACLDKAKRVSDFDTEGAQRFILGQLDRFGQASGEDLVNACKAHGFRPHEDRAFGPVFATLSRRGLIRCVGYVERAKGNGTAGGRVWTRVR
jgi:hypothetical protein